ncbi:MULTISPECIES: potassium-transporting ATPase subunit KdpB [unclassified Streptomyces]|uniref:potassium-transporting ATPase subunit KdpB n=1 Tax=unclassified Streptomyces TaxID=2593676 RepID=UPI002E2DCC06|nr:potassium-transporting ATPase subunit KdpB [Streptomyces sp. NBC_01439]
MPPAATRQTPAVPSPSQAPVNRPPRRRPGRGPLLESIRPAASFREALLKLEPRELIRKPVLFVVAVGSVLTTLSALIHPSVFTWVISGWLWLTVIFANFAEAVAEGRGRAQADSLRKARTDTVALRLRHWTYGTNLRHAETEAVAPSELQPLDVVLVEAGELIPADGDVIDGAAAVDESAVTGESAPVIREAGGDRSGVTGGTTVLSDSIVVRVSSRPGHSFMDRMIALVEGASRQKTPNEIALNILLAALTVTFVLVVVSLQPMAAYAGAAQTTTVLVALLVTLIPTTIGALLSAIGIAGMDRLVQRNVVAMSGRAVEAAGDVNTLLLDKTGTITHGNREAAAFIPLPGTDHIKLAEAAQLASLADETPEGRSVTVLAQQYGLQPVTQEDLSNPRFTEFSARTRMSGINLSWPNGAGCAIRKGAVAQVSEWVALRGGTVPPEAAAWSAGVSDSGGTPLLVAVHDWDGLRILGIIHLKDVVKDGIRERFEELRSMGIRTVMVTGDNERTARAIAQEAGVDEYLAEATPEDKMALIKREQAGGKLVAMTGDGTNDAPALAQADVGVAMNTGTSAAKEAGNMVDLDSNPTKLIDIVEIGKQLLITRGALTTFSITNDVAKYFAIIPAMFTAAYPGLEALNIMGLHSPLSAITSAIIFNALIIIALIPLALRGVRYKPASAHDLLRRNLAVYGLGGLILPFIGIKAIDLVVSTIPGLG